MRIYEQIIGVSWLAFLGVWLVLAIAGGRGSRSRSPRHSAMRLLAVVALLLAVTFGDRLPVQMLGPVPAGVATAGAVLCVIGLAFAISARVALGRNWGMPMTLHARPELITHGPYAYVRHPIYTGVLAMQIGTSLVFPAAAVVAVLMLAYFIFSARREEQDMERQFPDTYPAYRKRSKMLVPFLL